jgi:hypothetical protein
MIDTTADEREAGLVEVFLAGVDECDIGLTQRTPKARSHTDACRTTAYYYNTRTRTALGGISLIGTERKKGTCDGHNLEKLLTGDDPLTLHATQLLLEFKVCHNGVKYRLL